MESLSEEIWDIVIAGTSLPQALLALALSRSGRKILHVDRHSYYGGDDAGLSLDDASAWAEDVQNGRTIFSEANIMIPAENPSVTKSSKLASSRSYTLSLNPQIIYSQSLFLPSLVSSQIHSQLEFLAVGSWWIYKGKRLHKIPSTREDVFNDESLSVRDKRGLMKFLRFVLQEDQHQNEEPEEPEQSLQDVLTAKFNISGSLQSPLLALALASEPASSTSFSQAVRRIRRHLRSIGTFGPGFGAVLAKYGGNAEITQVACRAGAVGGGTYLLGHGITNTVEKSDTPDSSAREENDAERIIEITLSDGTTIKTHFLSGGVDDIPQIHTKRISENEMVPSSTFCSVSIVSSDLKHLFPPTAENGPIPAVTLILVETEDTEADRPPVYLQIHSEDTGESPSGQCIIYASTTYVDEISKDSINTAIRKVLDTSDSEEAATILWSMSFLKAKPDYSMGTSLIEETADGVFTFKSRNHDIALDDEVIDAVKTVWDRILGPDVASHTFLRFEEKEDGNEEE